jgi:putative N6-adenine-specific DNA methylase
MQTLHLFLPCAAGVESFLAQEVQSICGITADDLRVLRAGVMVRGNWRFVLLLNLHCRLAQRVLVEVAYAPYRQEQDLYAAACAVAWEQWFTPKQSFKIEITAQHSPLKSLNFAALKIKDAVADRFREQTGVRPDVETRWPDARIYRQRRRAFERNLGCSDVGCEWLEPRRWIGRQSQWLVRPRRSFV